MFWRILGACWPPSLAKMAASRYSDKPISRTTVKIDGKTFNFNPWLPPEYKHVNITHIHTHTYNTCISMLISTALTTAKLCNYPRDHQQMNRWRKYGNLYNRLLYIHYRVENYSFRSNKSMYFKKMVGVEHHLLKWNKTDLKKTSIAQNFLTWNQNRKVHHKSIRGFIRKAERDQWLGGGQQLP